MDKKILNIKCSKKPLNLCKKEKKQNITIEYLIQKLSYKRAIVEKSLL